jgi:hypothetical protein
MKEMLGHVYWGNTVESYLLAFACIVIGFVVLRIIKNYVLTRLKKVVSKTESNLDDIALQVVEKYGIPIFRILIIYIAIGLLEVRPGVQKWLNIAYGVVVLYFAVSFLLSLVRRLLEAQVMKLENGETKLRQIGGIMVVLKSWLQCYNDINRSWYWWYSDSISRAKYSRRSLQLFCYFL